MNFRCVWSSNECENYNGLVWWRMGSRRRGESQNAGVRVGIFRQTRDQESGMKHLQAELLGLLPGVGGVTWE